MCKAKAIFGCTAIMSILLFGKPLPRRWIISIIKKTKGKKLTIVHQKIHLEHPEHPEFGYYLKGQAGFTSCHRDKVPSSATEEMDLKCPFPPSQIIRNKYFRRENDWGFRREAGLLLDLFQNCFPVWEGRVVGIQLQTQPKLIKLVCA